MSTTPTSGCITSIVSVISSLLLLYSGVLAGADLGNHTKQFTPNSEMSAADWSSPDELDRTWQASLVRIPNKHKVFAGQISDLPYEALLDKRKLPTVIYLHGCSGICLLYTSPSPRDS